MADIKQAAKWMQEGKAVRRPTYFRGFAYVKQGKRDIVTNDGSTMEEEPLFLDDLLADDWEVVSE